MKKELLEIISVHNFWHKDQDTGIEREGLENAMKLVDIEGMATIVLGVRRAGKTYLTKQILRRKMEEYGKGQTLYVNFEDKALEPFIDEDILDEIYRAYRYEINRDKPVFIVLDEVHRVEGWERWVRTMTERKEAVKIIITGSGSRIISPRLATVLTGRKTTYNLFPLSFKEFLAFKGLRLKEYMGFETVEPMLLEYLEYGGFPAAVLAKEKEQKRVVLQEVYDDIITKDLMERFNLREENTLRKAAYLVLNNFSKYVSIRKIRNSLKTIMKVDISPSTLSNYLEYFERAYIFCFIPIYSLNIKDQMQYPRKAYSIDTGIINAILPRFSLDAGLIYENAVAVELLRRGKEIYYWKGDRNEVDFVIKNGIEVESLIQVTYAVDRDGIKDREINGLLRAMDEFKLNEGLVITGNFEGKEEIGGKRIVYIPMWKWLLG